MRRRRWLTSMAGAVMPLSAATPPQRLWPPEKCRTGVYSEWFKEPTMTEPFLSAPESPCRSAAHILSA
jgi:hypothetical protein